MTDEIGTVTMYPKLERREWIFGTLPDPRDLTIAALRESLEAAHRFGITNHERAERADARIAELEAALREIHKITGSYTGHGESARVFAAWRIADAALMPPPEGDMTMAVEEWDA